MMVYILQLFDVITADPLDSFRKGRKIASEISCAALCLQAPNAEISS